MLREAQRQDETDAAFLEREEAFLASRDEANAVLTGIRGNIEAHFGLPKRRVHDIIGRERKI